MGGRGEGACPAVYRPVSVNDEEPVCEARLRRRGRAAEGKQLVGLLRIYVVCYLNGDLTGRVLLACTVLYKRVIIDEINIFGQIISSPKSYKPFYLSIKLGC